MKRTDELQPGDIIYTCDFDSDYDDETPITPEEIADCIKRSVVIKHSTGLLSAQLEGQIGMHESCFTDKNIAHAGLDGLGGPDTRHATTPEDAIALCAEWLEKVARVQAADAAVLRKLLSKEPTP